MRYQRSVLLVVLSTFLINNQLADARRGGWLSGKRAIQVVERELDSCRTVAVNEHLFWDDMSSSWSLDVRQRGRHLEIRNSTWGSGVDSSTSYYYWRAAGCKIVGLEYASGTDSSRWKFTAYGRPQPTATEQVALTRMAGLALARHDRPRFGAARLLLVPTDCALPKGKQWRLCGPLYPVQPSFSGRPVGSPRALWRSAQVTHALPRKTTKKPKHAPPMEVTFTVPRPRQRRRQGRYRIFEAPLPVRGGAAVVAVYDTASRSHRWVFASRGEVLGKIRWVGGRGTLLVGEAESAHPVFRAEAGTSLFVLDLHRGTARKIVFPWVDPEGTAALLRARLVKDKLVVKGGNKNVVTISMTELNRRLGTGRATR